MPIAAFRFRPRWLSAALAVVAMTGCTTGSDDDPALGAAIRSHYAAHATEEEGACRSPRIDSIQDRLWLETPAGEAMVADIRYTYFDRHADMDAAYDKLVHLSQPCGGIGQRRFTVVDENQNYRVIDMSGEQRRRDGAR